MGRGWAVRRQAGTDSTDSCFWPGSAAEVKSCGVFVDSKDWATPLLRLKGVGRGGEERGGKGRATWAMWGGWAREAGVARWGLIGEGQQLWGSVVRVNGWEGGQTCAWAWMGRAGNAQGKAAGHPLPVATAFW